MTEKIEVQISGMTCNSCEVLLEQKFKEIKGVLKAKVNHKKGIAVLTCEEIPTIDKINQALKDTKYKISSKDNNDSTSIKIKREHLEIGAIFLIIIALYIILKQIDILPNFNISDNVSYGLAFLIGLVAAFSTCMAVSGGLLLAVSTKYNELNPDLTPKQKLKPHIYFNLGRIISYTLLGGLLGLLGSVISLSPKLTSIITILASLIMIFLGFEMLNIFKIKIFSIPKFISHKILDSSKNNSKSAPFLFGFSTFFLPCGFTQALQLYVLSQGSFLVGALTMLSFSLGTLPGIFSIGAISSFSAGNFKKHFVKFVGVLVILLGFFNISSGFTLASTSFDFSDNNIVTGDIIKDVDAKQVVEMKVEGLDYYPSSFNIKKGVPVEWKIDGSQAQGCAQILSVPKLGIMEQLPRDKIKTITFTPKSEGTIKFSCSMGMAGPGLFKVS